MQISEKLEKYDQLKEELEKLQDLTDIEKKQGIIEPSRHYQLYTLFEEVGKLEKELRWHIKHRNDK